jgi:hypothetical protein
MIEEGILPHVATVVPQEQPIAVQFIAQSKVAVLCIARIALPVLAGRNTALEKLQRASFHTIPVPPLLSLSLSLSHQPYAKNLFTGVNLVRLYYLYRQLTIQARSYQ